MAVGDARWRRYLAWYLATLLLAFLLVAGINAIVDPQGRLLILDRPGFNQVKIALKLSSRKGKATALRQCDYDTMVLGTSRAEMAFAMDYPPLNNGRSYNAALKAGSMYEIRRMGEYAMQHQDLESVLLSLDFVAFNEDLIYEEDFADSPLAETISPASLLRYLVSVLTLRESMATVQLNRRGRVSMCTDTGEHKRKRARKPARIAVDAILSQYSAGPYKRHVSGDWHLNHLDALLRQLASAEITVYAFISPTHVTQRELLSEMGRLAEYEDWKRSLVQVFADANAGLPEEQQAVLWDFSGYSEITTEQVPSVDAEPLMRWYSDSSHAMPIVGHLMLDQMLGRPSGEPMSEDAFGVLLTADNIESEIARARLDSERYRRENPDEIAHMQGVLRSNP